LRNNYTAYRNDRETLGGGVVVLVHNDIIAVENPELVINCELEWIKIQLEDRKDLLIGAFYMPHRNMEDVKELEKSLNLVSNKKTSY
jgi:hypothetical protein